MARRLVICNRKGGTGKTAVSVNLAGELAARGQKVLLVDLDPQSHCAAGVGLHPVSPFVHDLFHQPDADFSTSIRRTAVNGLWLSAADPAFDHSQASRAEFPLPQSLISSGADELFDTIVMDTPPSLDPLLLNALVTADSVIVPFVPHQLSMLGVRQLVKLLYDIKSSRNPALSLTGFLPTLANPTIRHHRQVMSELAHHFGPGRLLPAIRNDIRIAEAFSQGRPVRLTAPNSRGAEDFRQLADAIIRVQVAESLTA